MKIAILDYDNTLSSGLTRYEIGYAMEEADIIPAGFKEELMKLEGSYINGEIDYNKKYADDKIIFSKYFKGVKKLDAIRFLEEDYDIEKHINAWSSALIELLKDNGYLTVVISGSWDYIIEKAQELLDFDAFFASEFEVIDGKFTDQYKEVLTFERKNFIAEDLLNECGDSIGVGDSIADLSFLNRVDHPFMYEPNEESIEAIKKTNIKTVNEKNIINEVEKVL